MDGPRDCYTNRNTSNKDKYIKTNISFHMWNLKNDTNELIYKVETDSQT